MRARPNNRTTPVHLGRHIRNILTPQHSPQIAKVQRRIAIGALLGKVVQRKLLVVGEGEDLGGRQPGGVVDGGVVVEGLQGDVVLVGDARVVDVDQAVGRAAEEVGRGERVEG